MRAEAGARHAGRQTGPGNQPVRLEGLRGGRRFGGEEDAGLVAGNVALE